MNNYWPFWSIKKRKQKRNSFNQNLISQEWLRIFFCVRIVVSTGSSAYASILNRIESITQIRKKLASSFFFPSCFIFLLVQGISELLKSYWAATKGKWPGEEE